MSIYTPTTKHNWINRLRDYVHKSKNNPVQAVSPHLVNMDREVRRMQERMLREKSGKVVNK